MTTKKLYKLLDKVLPSGLCYNLRKKRNIDCWRARVWNSKQLDERGIFAPYAEGEVFPCFSTTTDDFKNICGLIEK